MDDHTRRLVDDDQVCILEADLERDPLRDRRGILNLRENYDEILVVSHAPRRVAQRRPIFRDITAFDQVFEPRPRQFGQVQREHSIEPMPGIARAGPYCRSAGRSRHSTPWPGLIPRPSAHGLVPWASTSSRQPILKVVSIRVISPAPSGAVATKTWDGRASPATAEDVVALESM